MQKLGWHSRKKKKKEKLVYFKYLIKGDCVLLGSYLAMIFEEIYLKNKEKRIVLNS